MTLNQRLSHSSRRQYERGYTSGNQHDVFEVGKIQRQVAALCSREEYRSITEKVMSDWTSQTTSYVGFVDFAHAAYTRQLEMLQARANEPEYSDPDIRGDLPYC